MRWRVGLLTASDSGRPSEREDTSALVVRELVEQELQGEIVDYRVVPTEADEISAALIEMSEYYRAHLIVTTGGTGLAPGDVMPEATRRVVDREVPGIAEAMRAAAVRKDRRFMFHRGIAGLRGRTLILNLPGTPEGVHAHLAGVLEDLPAALLALNRQERREDAPVREG